MAKTLIMVFQNDGGKNVSISIPDVRDNITEQEVKTTMQTILTKNIFTSNGGDLVGIMSAQIVNKDTTALNVR